MDKWWSGDFSIQTCCIIPLEAFAAKNCLYGNSCDNTLSDIRSYKFPQKSEKNTAMKYL